MDVTRVRVTSVQDGGADSASTFPSGILRRKNARFHALYTAMLPASSPLVFCGKRMPAYTPLARMRVIAMKLYTSFTRLLK